MMSKPAAIVDAKCGQVSKVHARFVAAPMDVHNSVDHSRSMTLAKMGNVPYTMQNVPDLGLGVEVPDVIEPSRSVRAAKSTRKSAPVLLAMPRTYRYSSSLNETIVELALAWGLTA